MDAALKTDFGRLNPCVRRLKSSKVDAVGDDKCRLFAEKAGVCLFRAADSMGGEQVNQKAHNAVVNPFGRQDFDSGVECVVRMTNPLADTGERGNQQTDAVEHIHVCVNDVIVAFFQLLIQSDRIGKLFFEAIQVTQMDGAHAQSNGFLLVDGDFLRVESHNDVQFKRIQRNVAKDFNQKGFDAVGGQTMGQNSNSLFCQNALLLGGYIGINKL